MQSTSTILIFFVIFCQTRLLVELLISFPKILVAAANGNTLGFGTALLALCDVVYANNKVGKKFFIFVFSKNCLNISHRLSEVLIK